MAIDMRGKITAEKIGDEAVDGALHIKAGSVQTAKFAVASVTSAVLADNSVTAPKVIEKIRTRPLAADDTEVSNFAAIDRTVDFEVKNVAFAVAVNANVPPDKIVVVLQLKTNLASSAATASLYIGSELTARSSISSISTALEVVTLSFLVGSGPGQLAEGVHTLRIKLKSALGAQVATLKLTEIYQVIL